MEDRYMKLIEIYKRLLTAEMYGIITLIFVYTERVGVFLRYPPRIYVFFD